MGVAIVIGDKELGLSIVSVDNLRHLESELLQTLPGLVDVGRRPIELDAFIVFRLYWCTRSPIDPEPGVFVMYHAAGQLAFHVHFLVHGKAEGFDPKAQAFFDVGAGDYGYTGFDGHIREVNELFYGAST